MLNSMQFQDMIVAEVSEADVTVIGLFAGMCTRVNFQLFRACKPFATTFDWALVRFLA